MNMDQIKTEIEGHVKDLLQGLAQDMASKDLDEKLKERLENATKAINDLNEKVAKLATELSDRAETIERLETEKSTVVDALAEKEKELVEASEGLEKATEKAAAVEAALLDIKKEKALSDRMAELENLKVARKGDSLGAQLAAVKGMSDEEYAGYRDNLVSWRSELLASLKEESPASESASSAEENTDGIVTPPADIGGKETAGILPNVISTPSVDLKTKYRKDFASKMSKFLEASRKDV